MGKHLSHRGRSMKAAKKVIPYAKGYPGDTQNLRDRVAGQIARDTFPAELAEAAGNAVLNAELAPDPRMDGATDVHLVPVEDIDALRAALALY